MKKASSIWMKLAFDVFVHFANDACRLCLFQTRLLVFDIRESRLVHFIPQHFHGRSRFRFLRWCAILPAALVLRMAEENRCEKQLVCKRISKLQRALDGS